MVRLMMMATLALAPMLVATDEHHSRVSTRYISGKKPQKSPLSHNMAKDASTTTPSAGPSEKTTEPGPRESVETSHKGDNEDDDGEKEKTKDGEDKYTPDTTSIDDHVNTSNCTQMDKYIKETASLFLRDDLTRQEYYKRNWLWVRCRTKLQNRFDMGGSWFGNSAELLNRRVRDTLCIPINYRFKYVNGKDWGDAMIEWDWGTHMCGQIDAVQMIMDLGKVAALKHRREFHIWDCNGYEEDPNWNTEYPGQNLGDLSDEDADEKKKKDKDKSDTHSSNTSGNGDMALAEPDPPSPGR